MKTARHPLPPPPASQEVEDLRARLADAEETLRAVQGGEVDTILVPGDHGPQVYMLEGAEHTYRLLIESMNEGALTLTSDGVILYANQYFARLVKNPLQQVMGSSFEHFLSIADQAILRPLLKRSGKSGTKVQALLRAGDGTEVPVLLSIRPLAGNGSTGENGGNGDGAAGATIGMVVTDMTETRHTEQLLRALSRRFVQSQEAERANVALELHDNVTQTLCGILIRWQVLTSKTPLPEKSSREERAQLIELLEAATKEAHRLSTFLRPHHLDNLGLVAAMRALNAEFVERTGVSLRMAPPHVTASLHPEAEMTLYRILQERLKNVEKHARARHVTVSLAQRRNVITLSIRDDGVGFDAAHQLANPGDKASLGLFGMRERAMYVGGTLEVESSPGGVTEIKVRIPLAPTTADD